VVLAAITGLLLAIITRTAVAVARGQLFPGRPQPQPVLQPAAGAPLA
jgi:hypothetical protein